MRITLSVSHVPASTIVLVLVGIFTTPATYSGGGSPTSYYPLIPNNFKI